MLNVNEITPHLGVELEHGKQLIEYSEAEINEWILSRPRVGEEQASVNKD